jgi:hypothetical protein
MLDIDKFEQFFNEMGINFERENTNSGQRIFLGSIQFCFEKGEFVGTDDFELGFGPRIKKKIRSSPAKVGYPPKN